MIEGFAEAYPALTWLAGGLALLVAEMLAPGVFMMWLGLAAIGVGTLVHFVTIAFAWQVVIFGAIALVLIGAALRLRRSKPSARLNTAESGLIGRSARVLSFASGEGRVRVGDSDWPARLAQGTPAPATGDVLRVVGVDGTVVVVGVA
jgi:membrane protein implicated in regulation of membrane protease activity